MPLYELFCIAAHANYPHLKSLVTTCATHVMDSGGVVRKLHSFGTCALMGAKLRNRTKHNAGDYWLMHFDANPTAMHALKRQLRKEPLVLQWTVTKLCEKVEDTFLKKTQTMSLRESMDNAVLRSSLNRSKPLLKE